MTKLQPFAALVPHANPDSPSGPVVPGVLQALYAVHILSPIGDPGKDTVTFMAGILFR